MVRRYIVLMSTRNPHDSDAPRYEDFDTHDKSCECEPCKPELFPVYVDDEVVSIPVVRKAG